MLLLSCLRGPTCCLVRAESQRCQQVWRPASPQGLPSQRATRYNPGAYTDLVLLLWLKSQQHSQRQAAETSETGTWGKLSDFREVTVRVIFLARLLTAKQTENKYVRQSAVLSRAFSTKVLLLAGRSPGCSCWRTACSATGVVLWPSLQGRVLDCEDDRLHPFICWSIGLDPSVHSSTHPPSYSFIHCWNY